MPRTFPGIKSEIPTEEESFLDGKSTGLTWTSDYRPGGPWTPKSTGTTHSDWNMAMVVNNREWLRGFDEGLAERKGLLS